MLFRSKVVLTSQLIYPLTVLDIAPETMLFFKKLIRSFLWAGTDKVSGGKCKVNWTVVCKPTSLGGLSLLNMGKFAKALRLRWAWLDWTTPERPWVGMEVPCKKDEMDLFLAMSTVTVGDGVKASFWDQPQAHRPSHL